MKKDPYFIIAMSISIGLIVAAIIMKIFGIGNPENTLVGLIGVFGLIDTLNTNRIIDAIRAEHSQTRELLRQTIREEHSRTREELKQTREVLKEEHRQTREALGKEHRQIRELLKGE